MAYDEKRVYVAPRSVASKHVKSALLLELILEPVS